MDSSNEEILSDLPASLAYLTFEEYLFPISRISLLIAFLALIYTALSKSKIPNYKYRSKIEEIYVC